MNAFKWFSLCAGINTIVALLSLNCDAQLPLNGPTPFDEQPAATENESSFSATPVEQVAQGPEKASDFCRCIGETGSPSVAKIDEALRGRLKETGIDFVDQPLEEVVNFVQEDYGIPVQLDLPALDEIGVAPDAKVTVNLHNISLGAALRLMLSKLGLTYVIQDEVLMITSPEEAEVQLITCVYDVRSLVDDTGGRSFDALIDTIVSCIETKTWAENGGGEAEIRPLKPGLLVISQMRLVHEKIRGLLTEIRELGGQRGPSGDAITGAEPENGEPLVTRTYYLQIKPTDEFKNLCGEVRDLIVQSLPDEVWSGRLDDGQAVVLKVLPDRIVVRHKESVQDQVGELLMDSGIATLTDPAKRGGGGGRGGGGIFQTDPAGVEP